MAATVRKWGNSLGIRIPRSIAEQVELHDGSTVEFETAGGVLTVRPTRKPRRRATLAQLLAKAKGPNPHGEWDRSSPRGKEII